jgi:hypothetical protein
MDKKPRAGRNIGDEITKPHQRLSVSFIMGDFEVDRQQNPVLDSQNSPHFRDALNIDPRSH